MLRRLVAATAAAGTCGLALLATGPAAGGERAVVAVEGRAEGLFFDLRIVAPPPDGSAVPPGGGVPVNFGFAPAVAIGPQSGSATDALAGISIPTGPFPPFTTALATVTTDGVTGPSGATRSSTHFEGIDFGGIAADQADSSCEATAAGVTGTAGFVNATVPSDPAPNTVITSAEQPILKSNITIILNEQEIVSDGTSQRITVTALHVIATDTPDAQFVGEFYAGRVTCAVTLAAPAPVAVRPTFTG